MKIRYLEKKVVVYDLGEVGLGGGWCVRHNLGTKNVRIGATYRGDPVWCQVTIRDENTIFVVPERQKMQSTVRWGWMEKLPAWLAPRRYGMSRVMLDVDTIWVEPMNGCDCGWGK